jgi:hypothetical protein
MPLRPALAILDRGLSRHQPQEGEPEEGGKGVDLPTGFAGIGHPFTAAQQEGELLGDRRSRQGCNGTQGETSLSP